MSPPELPADTPVLDVVHPVEVGFSPVFWHKSNPPVLDRLDGRLCERFDIDIPLVRQVWLDDCTTAVAPWQRLLVVLDFFEITDRFHIRDYSLACCKAIQPAVGLRRGVINRSVVSEDIVHLQTVALADFIVVEVVRRCHLHTAGTEFRIDVVVSDDWYASTHQRQDDLLSNQVPIAVVFRMHRDTTVAEHGFGACCRNDQVAVVRSQWIAEMPQVSRFICLQHLEVRQCRVQDRIPVDEAFAPVD